MTKKQRGALVALCTMMVAGALAPAAWGATSDPLFVFTPATGAMPPPSGYLDGPCGLGVGPDANFYIADYYHDSIDVYNGGANYAAAPTNGATGYLGRLGAIDPLDGPCGLALDASGRLFVNDYHRSVLAYGAFPSFGVPTAISGAGLDSATPTGLAADRAAGRIYVDQRTYAGAYLAVNGAPVEVVGQPLKVGQNPLADYYGAAVSRFGASAGYLYLPDAATNTVKVFDPASPAAAVQTITGPPGGFKSLREAAIAVDDKTGVIYVSDNLQPTYTERPEAAIYVFSAAGAYLGRLKYNVTDALPVGLAVDNSAQPSQGRVYVTSGNTSGASVFAYPPGAQTNVTVPVATAGGGGGRREGGAVLAAVSSTSTAATRKEGAGPPAASSSTVSQVDHLQVALNGKLAPRRLPRSGTAPISVSVGWKLSSTDGSPLPALKTLALEINRNGLLDTVGLPTCPYGKIQPASTSRALTNCKNALVGRGSFSALIGIGGQEPYATHGQMLLFNGRQGGKQVLLGQIYSPRPFANSFVIPFRVKRIGRGTYGTALTATLPASLRAWGNLTEIQMRLSRTYAYRGVKRSFLSAGCPAPKGFNSAVFPLARATFTFAQGKEVNSTLTDSCKVK